MESLTYIERLIFPGIGLIFCIGMAGFGMSWLTMLPQRNKASMVIISMVTISVSVICGYLVGLHMFDILDNEFQLRELLRQFLF